MATLGLNQRKSGAIRFKTSFRNTIYVSVACGHSTARFTRRDWHPVHAGHHGEPWLARDGRRRLGYALGRARLDSRGVTVWCMPPAHPLVSESGDQVFDTVHLESYQRVNHFR